MMILQQKQVSPITDAQLALSTLLQGNTLPTEGITTPKINLGSQLQQLILQEESKEVALFQLQQTQDYLTIKEYAHYKMKYRYRHTVAEKGYQLRQCRKPSLREHLQVALKELDAKTQKPERQWVYSISQGLLETQLPIQLTEQLIMLKRQHLPASLSLMTILQQCFDFALWLKRQVNGYQSTWEGQQLLTVSRLLQQV